MPPQGQNPAGATSTTEYKAELSLNFPGEEG